MQINLPFPSENHDRKSQATRALGFHEKVTPLAVPKPSLGNLNYKLYLGLFQLMPKLSPMLQRDLHNALCVAGLLMDMAE